MFRSQKAWEVEDQCAVIKQNAWTMRRQDAEDKERRRVALAALARFDNDAKEIRDEIDSLRVYASMPCTSGELYGPFNRRRNVRLPRSRFPRLPDGGAPYEGTCEVVKVAAQRRIADLRNLLAEAERIVGERRAELDALDQRLRQRNEDWDRGVRDFRRLGCTGNL
jgi:hypothetical protein